MCTGAYTTARTVKRDRVFDLTAHIERLAETARLMADDSVKEPGDAPAETTGTANGGPFRCSCKLQHGRNNNTLLLRAT
jgi:hypothetical protein